MVNKMRLKTHMFNVIEVFKALNSYFLVYDGLQINNKIRIIILIHDNRLTNQQGIQI